MGIKRKRKLYIPVSVDLAFDELLPKHALGNDIAPAVKAKNIF